MLDLKAITTTVGELEEDQVIEMIKSFIAENPTEEEANKVVNACQEGIKTVGELFEKGEYFIGDLIFAGELLTEAIHVIKPVIGSEITTKTGTIVLGTIFGDLHEIGKNIFRSMAEAGGFEVFDIGIDQPVSAFIEKIKEVKPDIVGMSGVLTLAFDEMKEVVEGLKEVGLRDDIKVIIGGNFVTKEACKHVGADAFTNDAAEGVRICKRWIANKK